KPRHKWPAPRSQSNLNSALIEVGSRFVNRAVAFESPVSLARNRMIVGIHAQHPRYRMRIGRPIEDKLDVAPRERLIQLGTSQTQLAAFNAKHELRFRVAS